MHMFLIDISVPSLYEFLDKCGEFGHQGLGRQFAERSQRN